MPSVMLALGEFRFESNVNPFNDLSRTIPYRWQEQSVLAAPPRQQYIGPGRQTVTISGAIYPLFRGGLGQIDAMMAEADKGSPLRLVDGLGNVWGQWVINSISEVRSSLFPDGMPRSVTFTMEISFYG